MFILDIPTTNSLVTLGMTLVSKSIYSLVLMSILFLWEYKTQTSWGFSAPRTENLAGSLLV